MGNGIDDHVEHAVERIEGAGAQHAVRRREFLHQQTGLVRRAVGYHDFRRLLVKERQQHAARGDAIGEMKADGLEYDERMALLEEITWPQPLRELLEALYETYRQTHPWLPDDALGPKSVVREMWENGMGFTDFVRRYELARSEGLVLRYLSDAYRTLRQTVPDAHRSPDLETIIEWLGETIRQTDSSLIDEWAALTDPESVRNAAAAHGDAPPPPRPITANDRAFRAMVRQAMWRRVELAEQGTLVQGVHLGAADTDIMSGYDGPMIDPAVVPRASLDGLVAGAIEVVVDDWSAMVKASLAEDPAVFYARVFPAA